MLEVRAKTDAAAAAGQDIIQGFLTEPDTAAVYRSPLPLMFVLTSVLPQIGTDCICCIVIDSWWGQRCSSVPSVSIIKWTHRQVT